MGLLVEGKWVDEWYDTESTGGKFVRKDSSFRDWITKDGKIDDEDRKAYLALSVVVPILLHGCYDFLAFAQEGDSRFTLLFYAYLIALYVFGIRRVNRSSRDDRRVTRETVFDYFRRMQYPLPPQYRDRNDDFWR